jgi:hypothetical protein
LRLAAEAGNQVAVHFAVAVEVFVLLELLLELGLNDVNRSIHINRIFFDNYGLVRQVKRNLAGTVIVVLGLAFFEVDFGVGALAVMAGNIAVKATYFFVYVSF